jgi:hypothetical protein
MAEMMEVSRGFRRRNGAIGGLVAALRQGLASLAVGRSNRLRAEEWPDYLLRDIGLDRTIRDEDPRGKPTDWLGR